MLGFPIEKLSFALRISGSESVLARAIAQAIVGAIIRSELGLYLLLFGPVAGLLPRMLGLPIENFAPEKLLF